VGSDLYRAATTKYPCYVPILGDSEGAGRAGLPVCFLKSAAKVVIFGEENGICSKYHADIKIF
jgi:hypothetical protein